MWFVFTCAKPSSFLLDISRCFRVSSDLLNWLSITVSLLLFSPITSSCQEKGQSIYHLLKLLKIISPNFQSSAARILTRTKTSEHISPVLESLHWLPIRFQIDFKMILLTYNALHGAAPHYLSQLLTVYPPIRELRSSDSNYENQKLNKSTAK